MAVFEVRLRAGETGNWAALSQRATLAGDPGRIRAGDTQANLAGIVALRGVRQLALPEMITLSPKLSIMRSEITVGLFNQVMQGYVIEGHNANHLKALIADPKAAESTLTYVNLFDAQEFAKRLSEHTARRFRVQTEEEWLRARNQLSGKNWTWTETPSKFYPDTFVLRRLDDVDRSSSYGPEDRYDSYAVRLVEDLK